MVLENWCCNTIFHVKSGVNQDGALQVSLFKTFVNNGLMEISGASCSETVRCIPSDVFRDCETRELLKILK